jgi:hypothetical protein
MNRKNENVTFRRINGRIVPIAAGSGLVYGGAKIGSEKFYNKHISKILFKPEKMKSLKNTPSYLKTGEIRNSFTVVMEQKYRKQLKAAKVKDVVSDLPGLSTEMFEGTIFSRRKPSVLIVTDIKTKVKDVEILAPNRSRFAFLHELGHAESIKKKSITNKLQNYAKKMLPINYKKEQNAFPFVASKTMLNSKAGSFKRKILLKRDDAINKIKKFGFKQQRAYYHAIEVPEEVNAWFRGARHLRTPRQKIAMLKSGIKPLFSYAVFPLQQATKLGLIAAGIGTIGYGLLKNNKRGK